MSNFNSYYEDNLPDEIELSAWDIYSGPDYSDAVDNTHLIYLPNGRVGYEGIYCTRTDNICLQRLVSDSKGLRVIRRYIKHNQTVVLRRLGD